MGGQWFEVSLALGVVLFPMLLAWAYLSYGAWRRGGRHASRRDSNTQHGDCN